MLRTYKAKLPPNNNFKEKVFRDFEYLIYRKPQSELCFGTKLERCTEMLPNRSLNGFMRRVITENNLMIDPGKYANQCKTAFYDILNKPSSTLGTCSRGTRFPETIRECHTRPKHYASHRTRGERQRAPFNSTSQRKLSWNTDDNPSPCRYEPRINHKQISFKHSFNGKKVMEMAVDIKCVQRYTDRCEVCNVLCRKQGDYWHRNNKTFICRTDFQKLQRNTDINNGLSILTPRFKPIRDCSFMHLHRGGKTAIKLMDDRDVIKKARKEAYLQLYFPHEKK